MVAQAGDSRSVSSSALVKGSHPTQHSRLQESVMLPPFLVGLPIFIPSSYLLLYWSLYPSAQHCEIW